MTTPMFTPPDLTEPMPASLEALTAPTPAKAPRKPGRPKGAKTAPAKKAAAAARRRGPVAPGKPTAPEGTPAEDVAAARVAEQLAAAAVPPESESAGGRPPARTAALRALAEQLATAYQAVGGMLTVGGLALAGVNPVVAGRVSAVGAELTARADECGLALARWADTSPRVRAWLTNLSTGSGAMLVVAAHAPIIAAAFGRPDVAMMAGMAGAMFAPDDTPTDPAGDLGNLFATVFGQQFAGPVQGDNGTAPA